MRAIGMCAEYLKVHIYIAQNYAIYIVCRDKNVCMVCILDSKAWASLVLKLL